MRVALEQEKAQRVALGDPATSEDLKVRLANANRRLADQTEIVEALKREKDILEGRLRRAPTDKAIEERLRSENEALKKQLISKNSRSESAAQGRKAEKEGRDFLYRGISARPFKRQFTLADHVEVKSASFENGLLVIELAREIPEAMKPRKIEIGATAPKTVSQIDARAA